jgi:hypothetical protein
MKRLLVTAFIAVSSVLGFQHDSSAQVRIQGTIVTPPPPGVRVQVGSPDYYRYYNRGYVQPYYGHRQRYYRDYDNVGYRRVWVPGFWDEYGEWVPGHYRTVRVYR